MRSGSLLAALSIALLVAACGDGSSDTASPSTAQFVKEANAVCKAKRRGILHRVTAYLQGHVSSGKPEKMLIADMVKAVLLPTIEAETKALEALEPPEDDQAKIDEMLSAQRDVVSRVAGLRRVDSMEEVEDRFNKVSDDFRAYGIEACANSAKPVDRRL